MSEQQQTPEITQSEKTAMPRKKGKIRRVFKWLFVCVGVLLIVFSITLYYLLGTHSGLKTLAFRLPEKAGVSVTADNLQGTVWRGFSAQNIRIRNPQGLDIALSDIKFDWHANQLWKRHLKINHLALGKLYLNSFPKSGEKHDTPPVRLPENISLPLKITVAKVSSDEVFLGENQTVLIKQGAFSYSYDHKQHAANIDILESEWGTLKGNTTLINQTPFAINGKIDLNGTINQEVATGTINLSGSLKDLSVQSELSSASAVLNMDAIVSPFTENMAGKAHHITVHAANINPRDFWHIAPVAQTSLFLNIAPNDTHQFLNGLLVLANEKPQAIDLGGLPFSAANSEFEMHTDGLLLLHFLSLDFLNNGNINLSGSVKNELDLTAEIKKLTLSDILSTQSKLPLDGQIKITGKNDEPKIAWDFTRGKLTATGKLNIDKEENGTALNLQTAAFHDDKGGIADISGSLKLYEQMPLGFVLQSKNFNPVVLGDLAPAGRINGEASVSGSLLDTPDIVAELNFKDSIVSDMPLNINGKVQYADNHIAPSQVAIHLGENKILADGSLGRMGDKMQVDITAPTLAQFGFGFSGSLKTQGFIADDFQHLKANLHGNADNFAFKDIVKLQKLNFDIVASPDQTAPLKVALDGNHLTVPSVNISTVKIDLNGTQAAHNLTAFADLVALDKPYRTDIAANGGLDKDYNWHGVMSKLNASGTVDLALESPVKLIAGSQLVELGQAKWRVFGGGLNLQHFSWRQKGGIKTQGKADNIQLSHLKNIVAMPVEQNLVLNADWNVQYDQNAQGTLSIRRVSGDITLPNKKRTLGLDKLEFDARLFANKISNKLIAETAFGHADATLDIAQTFGDNILAAPISGSLKLLNVDLSKIKAFLPPDMDLGGNLSANTDIRGTVGDPLLSGHLDAEKLRYIQWSTGVVVNNGTLKSRFDGNRWVIDQLAFINQRTGGKMEITGEVVRTGFQPDARLKVLFNQYPVLRHPDRRVTISGGADIHYADNLGLALTGDLKLDEAQFDFPKASMPKVDDDVIVLGDEPKAQSNPLLLAIDLNLDLNDAFTFSGQGLNVVMGGKLNLNARPKEDIKLLGTVNVVSGRYKAYGQDLEIQKGQITFVGAIDNPALNIRAVRRLSPVGAGVEVTGFLAKPRAVLVADEAMSDKDKLAWLVLGRPAAGGDDAALAAAAGSMLAGGINNKIGLFDDIGLSSRETRNSNTGEVNPAEQMVNVGKHLSNRLYLGYEYGLNSTTQAVKMVYQLSKSVQVIGRAGTDSSGGEIRYSKRFD
ncbi:MAG: translocation/assembly module TamB domain-containing protein [Neisseriaceae bacterium]|nr:translocation/assembly module TamB domain-containing protein [Neisseriaceae bacterium]